MSAATSPAQPASVLGKGPNAALWVVQVLLAVMFFMAGGSKVGGAEKMIALFETIGIGQWLRYLTGILELFGAVLLLLPRAAGYGAVLLAAVMVGAVVTHVAILHGRQAMPLVLLVGTLFVACGRREPLLSSLCVRSARG